MKPLIVVKIGSNVLTQPNGGIDVKQMSALVEQVAGLRELGYDVIMVSSGSVASGRSELKSKYKLDGVEQRQLFSSVGQVRLIGLYYDLFCKRGLHIGQILTMKENFSTRREYLNQRSCMTVMLQNGVIPIINENDTVSITELMFTDNDELSGLIASMMNAERLIILSNVDGIFNGPPDDPKTKVIPQLSPDEPLDEIIQTEKSEFGRGGMISKCRIARQAAAEGIRVYIANGRRPNILTDLLTRPSETLHTEFLPAVEPVSSMKKWIAHSADFAKGVIRVNAKAAKAMLDDTQAVSLLPVGVVSIDGDFEEGDLVGIVDPQEQEIAVGRASYSSEEARPLIGKHRQKPLVHCDYLYLMRKEE